MMYNNISRSTCKLYGSFVIIAPKDVGVVSFCIIDSSQSTFNIIDSRYTENVMNFSTIINNTANNTVISTAYENSKFTITDCNVINNNAIYLLVNYHSSNSLSAYRLYIQNTNTTCNNARLFETVEQKHEFDFNVLHLVCDSIPNYYVNLNICSVCNNNCIRGFLHYSLYLVFILL